MRFAFTHSHAFPGSRVTVEDDGGAAPWCLVEFGGGTAVVGEWRHDRADILLEVPDYRTARGTQIGAKRWRLVRRGDGSWRIVDQIPGNGPKKSSTRRP